MTPRKEPLIYEEEKVWHDEECPQSSGLPSWVWSIGVLIGSGLVIDLGVKVAKNVEVSPAAAAFEVVAALAAFTLAAAAKL